MKRRNRSIFLWAILILNLSLTIIGLNWGLPNRWCVDEQVANSLKLIASKSIFTVVTNVHPQLYNLFLGLLFIPYLIFKKIVGYPLGEAALLANISWMDMAHSFGGFASGLYLIARFSSVLLGVLTIYLLYRVAFIIHDKKAALFAALTLAVSMGFVETNHLAKHTSLVVFLVLLVLFFCLRSLEERKYFRRYFYLASFFCGLAATAKLDGIISLLFILGTIIYLLFKDNSSKIFKERFKPFDLKLVLCSAFLFISGVITGWPAVLVNFDKYYQTQYTHNGIFFGGFHILNLAYLTAIVEKVKDSFVLLIRNFSLPLSIFVFWGIADFLRGIKRYPYSAVIASMFVPYIFICLTYFTEYPGISTKLVVHAIVLSCIFAGKVIADFVSPKKQLYGLRKAVISGAFLFAVFYTFQADLFFSFRDTRYYSTAWILNNIPMGETIEHYQEGENLFSTSEIPFKYDVIFWGRHSKDFRGKKSLYFRNVEEKLRYRNRLNEIGSEADLFIIALGGEFVMEVPPSGTFLERLYKGEKPNFRLAKVFKKESNFFFKPRPEWTSPDIYIYERIR